MGALTLGTAGTSGCSPIPGTLRHRVVTGLADQGSDSAADIAADRATDLLLVELPVLQNWRLVDLRNTTMSHPYRLHLAVTVEGDVRVVVLTDFPERWPQLLAGARVTDADEAVYVARTHFDVTRTMATWGTRLDSFDDIDFVADADPDVVAALREQYADRIGAPEAESSPEGWTMTLWAVENDTELVERRTRVARDADVTVARTVHADDLPVPVSI